MTIELERGMHSHADALTHHPFPEHYVGDHLLYQLARGPLTVREVAKHQHWMLEVARSNLEHNADAGVLVRDGDRYGLNVPWLIDVLELVWPRFRWEQPIDWMCDGCPGG